MSLQVKMQSSASIDWGRINQETEKIIRQHSKTFFFATSLLPRSSRTAIRSLYAFCRQTDDMVDKSDSSMEALEAWRNQVNQSFDAQHNPVLVSWSRVREEYKVNRRFEQELISGVEMDLQRNTYQTWEELKFYCYHVASTVGLLSIPIIGMSEGASLEQTEKYATILGIALQLTNILRDVGEDLNRGHIYLPIEDLERFGLTLHDIRHQSIDERFKNLMRFEIQRARNLYSLALPGIALLNRTARPAVGAAALLYQAILDEIEAIDYQVFKQRAFTTGWRKLALLPRILLNISRLKPPPPDFLPLSY
jgi:15-cis-phytoene synthase